MSGVYIKGMEIPTSCCSCPLFKSNMSKQLFCKAFGAFDKSDYDKLPIDRMKNCPLISVPPHGRCVDADVLFRTFETVGWWDNDDRDKAEDILLDAPTIIPAEEE